MYRSHEYDYMNKQHAHTKHSQKRLAGIRLNKYLLQTARAGECMGKHSSVNVMFLTEVSW